MKNKLLTCLLIASALCLHPAETRGGNVTVITALANSSVSLPCDISIPNVHERVTFILWYREDLGIPIFSMEVGGDEVLTSSEALSTSVIWSDEKWLGARAHFRPETFPATLRIDDVMGVDAGQYRCRVDFTDAPTRNTLVNLTVIVPPDPLVIFDETGKRRASVVGPYLVGDSIHLVCDAFGGNPVPRVTWTQSGRLIDETYHILSNGTVRNEITFRDVDRSFLRTRLTCEATNTNLSRPVKTTVDVDMNFAPIMVEIANKVDQLVVGRESEIVCRSTGSRPPAHITWYLGGQRLEGGDSTESASSDGNATVSILRLRPKMDHIGQSLVCKATNPLITQSDLFDNMDLNIDYAPRVELALGKSISPGSIYEGGDVYFDCLVDASPKPHKILWFQDDTPLHHNTAEGVILTNRSLVLQGIDRTRSGGYTCQALNAVGSGQSQVIKLDVKYVPVCRNADPVVLGVGNGEMVDVFCDVVANPNVDAFHWAFNNSAGLIHVPAGRATTQNGTRSKLTYTPRNNKDYGTLMCEAKNEVGKQKAPCIFHIILAVVPEPVANCTTINPSAEHFRLSCKPGFDGGMEQYFEVIVRENNSGAIVYNITIAKGLEKLDVRNLSAGVSYIATLTPRNKKGPGQSINFEFDTIMHPKVEVTQVEDAASAAASGSSTENENDGFFNSEITVMIGGILAGILVSFGVLAVVGFICVQNRQTMSPGSGKVQTEVVVPGGALGDGNSSSIIGTTVLQPQHSQRKGILKRTATQDCGAQNNWDYQLSPEQKRKEHHDDHSRENPDILQLPMGLPPPPPSGSSAGTTLTNAISDECELCLNSSSTASPPPPPLEAPAGFSPAPPSSNNGGMRLQPLMKAQPSLAFLGRGSSDSRTLPRRISREGVLNEAGGSMGSEVTAIDLDESMHQLSRGTGNDGSSDPLLQIPTQLSAVLTMKRGGSPKHRRSQSKQINTTPLLKRKRESIV